MPNINIKQNSQSDYLFIDARRTLGTHSIIMVDTDIHKGVAFFLDRIPPSFSSTLQYVFF